MANGNGGDSNALTLGGANFAPYDPTDTSLSISPNLLNPLAGATTSGSQIILPPATSAVEQASAPITPAPSPTQTQVSDASTTSSTDTTKPPMSFDYAFGDSIAVQQLYNNRIPGFGRNNVGPQYGKPGYAQGPGQYAAVGDPPQSILDRFNYLAQQDPNFLSSLKGKNLFLGAGSNDTTQLEAINTLLSKLHDAGVGNVVVPGLGPGVKGSADANKQLQDMVTKAGYTFFQPNLKWQPDGVHPANSQNMYDQATKALRGVPQPPASPEVVSPTPSVQTASATPTVGAPTPLLDQKNQLAVPYTGPHQDIYNYAQYYGVDPSLMMTMGSIESDFGRNPQTNAPGRGHIGVFQLGDPEWKSMGGTDANRLDYNTQLNLGTAFVSQRQQELADALGRTPTNPEIYLAHQQGVAGAKALLNNPNTPAAEALLPAMPSGSTLADAAAHIKDNGGDPNAPASQFVTHWNDMYARKEAELNNLKLPGYASSLKPSSIQYPAIPPYEPAGAFHPGDPTYTVTSDPEGSMVTPSGYAVGGYGSPDLRVAGVPASTSAGVPMSPVARNLLQSPPGSTRNTAEWRPPPPNAQAGQNESDKLMRMQRALMMMSIIKASMQGVKLHPVDYDPFKVMQTNITGGVVGPAQDIRRGTGFG